MSGAITPKPDSEALPSEGASASRDDPALSPEESAVLADALDRLLAERYDFTRDRPDQLPVTPAQLPRIWSALGEIGLHGLMLPRDFDGIGGEVAELQLVQQVFGRRLVVAPWFENAICARALVLGGSPEQQAAWLPFMAEGGAPMVPALRDAVVLDGVVDAAADGAADGFSVGAAGGRAVGAAFGVQAEAHGAGWRLHGQRAAVAYAACASRLLVAARLADGSIGLFVVEAQAAGLAQAARRLVDGSWVSGLRFDGVAAEPLAGLPLASHGVLLRSLHAFAIAGVLAESLGACEAALTASVQYLRTRKQFGQPLADYQALRHRVAEMYIEIEQLRSACELAAEVSSAVASPRGSEQALLVGMQSATWVLQQAIQLHGGMGMTEALPVGHHYRRLLVQAACWGDAREALSRLRKSSIDGAQNSKGAADGDRP